MRVRREVAKVKDEAEKKIMSLNRLRIKAPSKAPSANGECLPLTDLFDRCRTILQTESRFVVFECLWLSGTVETPLGETAPLLDVSKRRLALIFSMTRRQEEERANASATHAEGVQKAKNRRLGGRFKGGAAGEHGGGFDGWSSRSP